MYPLVAVSFFFVTILKQCDLACILMLSSLAITDRLGAFLDIGFEVGIYPKICRTPPSWNQCTKKKFLFTHFFLLFLWCKPDLVTWDEGTETRPSCDCISVVGICASRFLVTVLTILNQRHKKFFVPMVESMVEKLNPMPTCEGNSSAREK